MKKHFIIATALLGAGIAAQAANVDVTSDIATSTTWTKDNVYNLTKQIYVRAGATLTIQEGTLVQSTTGVGGSLAVSRGAKIYVNGTKDEPVIMTSTSDTLTEWHEGCNEWGNLTLMGRGLIGASSDSVRDRGTNTKTPTGLNVVQMEGLTDDSVNDTYYGGNDDNDDSGSISYLSLRYGGKVVGLANELNGLSLGAIGRETDIHHVEIMNNVDDGIEIWGGTVNLKYLNIWNVGDDSLDIDQGYRGKIQFGLIVQGYSTDDSQGSGLGDNCIEIDGAEDSDAQPVTTTKIANFTVIGNYLSGDGATTWRDNARVQYHNCIFADIGEEAVRYDNTDGDGAQGYGYNGTLSWADTWTTAYTNYSAVNWVSDIYADQADCYPVQTSGYLAEMKGCLFNYCNESDSGDQILALGIVNGSAGAWESNPALDNIVTTADPIVGFERGPTVTRGGKSVALVTNINPCAQNEALSVANPEASDGFFVNAPFRGAFSSSYNWLAGWTSVDQYGMTETGMNGAAPAASIASGVVVSFPSEFGVEYEIQGADSADGDWSYVASVVGDGSYIQYGDADLQASGFYRVVVK
ncbi:hypothetical protein [Pontiella sp.]|uniref:hypothetical protein n=1 Tax=Pontiella sp. TaxID=2837462 RepID=UPI003569D47C